MHVDVLVLTYNALDVTRRFVEKLYANTDVFDLYVLDNGSTDGTREWLADQETAPTT
jgi:GT2 family glycosyltransferase